MELAGATLATWLLNEGRQLSHIPESVVKSLIQDRITRTTPEACIRLTVHTLAHDWSAFRKRMLFLNIQTASICCFTNGAIRPGDFYHDTAEAYAKWVINHPGIKEAWIQINNHYQTRRSTIKELNAPHLRKM